ncbi:MAG: hypothetical protein JWM87_1299 [Candidatus Eremiobacteraeota bacterium]|nr:hypothetical protein [Candidatus Eremiobacteraeota bacterium]
MKWIVDPTRRFSRRPHYDIDELERSCEELISEYFSDHRLEVEDPLATGTLSKLLEYHVARCDFGTDLSEFGEDVEALTQFSSVGKPVVLISAHLREPRLERRRRMTMAHELGHVRFHGVLFEPDSTMEMFPELVDSGPTYCRRSTIARGGDWMEWQASFAAGAFLMPLARVRDVVTAELTRLGTNAPIAHDDPRARYLCGVVADRFFTSIESASIRLLQCGFVLPRSVQTFRWTG